MKSSSAVLILFIIIPGAIAATSSHKAVRITAVSVGVIAAALAIAGIFD